MAKRKRRGDDTVPELAFERYLNCVHVKVTSGANSSSTGSTTIETGMMLAETARYKWVVFSVLVQPATITDAPTPATTMTGTVMFEMAYGATALNTSDRNNVNVICRGMVTFAFLTSGIGFMSWPRPLDIVRARPVLTKQLTLSMRTGADRTAWQSKDFIFSIYYGISPATDGDIMEEIKVRGAI